MIRFKVTGDKHAAVRARAVEIATNFYEVPEGQLWIRFSGEPVMNMSGDVLTFEFDVEADIQAARR